MADENSLDDFFAKKDKSKKKSSKSRITPDDIGMMLEKKLAKGSKKSGLTVTKKKDKESTNNTEPFSLSAKVVEDDGEWKEFEEETEKDYSGLRIQNLQISSKDEDDKDYQDNGQSGEDEDGERKDVPQGPWRAVAAPAVETANIAEPAPKLPAAEVDKDAPKSTGKYIPPAARNKGTSSSTTMSGMTGTGGTGRKKTAPNVNSQDEFPTLGSAIDPSESMGQQFEKVRSGGRQMEDPANKSVKLSLGNKYATLEGKDS